MWLPRARICLADTIQVSVGNGSLCAAWIHVLYISCAMLVVAVVVHFAWPVCTALSVLGLFLPAAAALVNDLLCLICFCRKRAQLFHDGRNVTQLRGKAVLVLSQILCAPLSLSTAPWWDRKLPMLPLKCCASGPASHSFHPKQGNALHAVLNNLYMNG